MKFMIIVKATANSEAGALPDTAMLAGMGSFNEDLVRAGVMEAGEGLQPSARGARVHFSATGQHVVRGPFPETAQLVAGFWLWNCASLDEAIAWARRCPMPQGAELEIRPAHGAEDFGEALTPDLRAQEEWLREQVARRRGT